MTPTETPTNTPTNTATPTITPTMTSSVTPTITPTITPTPETISVRFVECCSPNDSFDYNITITQWAQLTLNSIYVISNKCYTFTENLIKDNYEFVNVTSPEMAYGDCFTCVDINPCVTSTPTSTPTVTPTISNHLQERRRLLSQRLGIHPPPFRCNPPET